MFIKLTRNGKELIGNVNLLQSVFVTSNGKVGVVGWCNNGFFEVDETYEEVLSKIEKVTGCSLLTD